jgi:hypothetical protein
MTRASSTVVMESKPPTALAVSVVCRQLQARGPLPESSVITIVENATGVRPSATTLATVAVAAADSVVVDVATRVWTMAAEAAVVYAACKPGGVPVADLSTACRMYLRQHGTRLLNGTLKMLAPGVVGAAADASHKTIAQLVAEAGPSGLPIKSCPGSAADAIAASTVVYVSGRLYAAPAGPRYDAAAAGVWHDRHKLFLKE